LKSPRVSSEIATSVLPDSTLFGVGTATVDGILSPGEWDAAGSIDLVINLPGGGTEAATLFVMNDATDLYLALRFARSVVDPGNSLVLEFDNNDDGVAANGDDVIVFNPAVGFFDGFRTNEPPCPPGSPERRVAWLTLPTVGRTMERAPSPMMGPSASTSFGIHSRAEIWVMISRWTGTRRLASFCFSG